MILPKGVVDPPTNFFKIVAATKMTQNLKIKPKRTLGQIALDLGFTTRQGQHQRADIDFLIFSLQPFKSTLLRKHKFDLDTFPRKKTLPYSVTLFIFSKLQ